ncbi:MAG: bifunctional 4-hydroxy-3-methylbut-2-enyl diphosphate reductase/30S ribosomal protein S1 [Halanaerobiales bacterium]|nr:bifunctional 4-hydroxy-3-methylbut-2-enyl diphosphate reductase/30S ribosomal protein S1 [Halanaerobiales bacterium]
MVLEIVLADHAGFCYGVKRATDLVINLAKNSERPLFTLGPLIHNPQVVEYLETFGVQAIDDYKDVDEGIIFIRSHGVPDHIISEIKQCDLKVVDATCPFVKRAQEYAKKLHEDGYQVIICGDENHPEVIGIVGSINYNALVVKNASELAKHNLRRKVGVVAQTTLSIQQLEDVVTQLVHQVKELKVFNTICTTTEERQKEASDLANKVDLMLVIGGKNSANTNRLAEICRNVGIPTYLIETADELKNDWFNGIHSVGVTAGASTPNWIIKEVIRFMSEFTEEKKEVLTEEVSKEVSQEVKTDDQKNMMLDHSIPHLKKGEKIKGTVIQVKDDSVFVNIGYKSEGLITLEELSFQPVQSAHEVVKEGDELEVVVLGIDEEEGIVKVSHKRAAREQAWEAIMSAYEKGEILEAKVTRVVKGGLVADVGLRGFIPASHVDIDYVENLEQFVGQTLQLKVIEVDRANNNVVLSRKAIMEVERKAKKAETLANLQEGQSIEGTVTKIVDFGAFIDLGGVEGLLHISEMSWGRINHPSEIIKERDAITVKVLKVDNEKERIALGLKQILPDPWSEFLAKHQEGEVVTGTITKTVDFGAFMEIESGVEGLIHISQLSRRHVETPTEVVKAGDKVEAKILNINEKDRKVGLSMKELEPAPAQKPRVEKPKKARKEKTFETYSTAPKETSGFSIGEMVGDIFKS